MLNSKEIADVCKLLKLAVDNEYNKKVIRVSTADDLIFYIKKSVDTNPLVLHPNLISRKDEIDTIDGLDVNWAGLHNANLIGYEKKINKGKEPSYYGFDASLSSKSTLNKLLHLIAPLSFKFISSPFDEISEAEASLPKSETTRKTIVEARIGQGQFRKDLINHWGSCAATGASNTSMLKASHIKPWKDSDNRERLDQFNGLLLTANLDAAFDSGLISFNDLGELLISDVFDDANDYAISASMRLKEIQNEHKPYLQHHRNNVFKGKP